MDTLDTMRAVLLLAATLFAGVMAGLFLLYAHTVMPGLGATDDRTFVGAFQAIDRKVNNWFVFTALFGAPVLTALVALAHRGPLMWWLVLALVLLVASIVITATVNVPLNNAIKAAGDPDTIANLAQVRAGFREPWWRTWNVVRCATSTAAFASLAWSLFLLGRQL